MKSARESYAICLPIWGTKTREGTNHPARNSRSEYINEKVVAFQQENCPTISVDTKKKENIGNYENGGREYCRKGKPTEVGTHDFPNKNLGKAASYGVYDIGKNKGWVSVGISSDTSEFAVNTIRARRYGMGNFSYRDAEKILITADCGGSNGYRVRLWKTGVQKSANETGKEIHICHFPPGTSKWNKIEHRMFSYISKNRRGRPLLTREAVVSLIAGTKINKGLKIKAIPEFDELLLKINILCIKQNLCQLLKPVNCPDFKGLDNYDLNLLNGKIKTNSLI